MGSLCSGRGNQKLEAVFIISWPAYVCPLVLSPLWQGSGELCCIAVAHAFSFPNTICCTDLLKRKIKSLIHCYCVNRIPLRALTLSCQGIQCAIKSKRCLQLWDKGATKTERHPLVSSVLQGDRPRGVNVADVSPSGVCQSGRGYSHKEVILQNVLCLIPNLLFFFFLSRSSLAVAQ